MATPIKIYYDAVKKVLRNSAGTEITDANLFPSATFGNKMWFNLQLVSDSSLTAYEELPTGATAEILVDNNYNNPSPILPVPGGNSDWTAGTGGTSEYYFNGSTILTKPTIVYFNDTEATEGTKGALTAGQWAWDAVNLKLYVRLTDSTDPDTKGAGYVEFKETVTGATDPFIEVDGSTFNQADSWDDAGVMRTPVITDGEISFYITANTIEFYRRIATSANATNTTIQVQMLAPSTAFNFITFEFSFICRNKYLGKGYTLDVTGMNVYMKAETDALLRAGRDLQFSVDGSTSWHDTQVPADLYWRERYPEGEWSVAIAMPLAPEVMFLYSVLGTDSWHTPYAGGDEYFKVSTDGGVTYSGAILFRGIQGIQGIPGISAFVYTAYASDSSGTGFSLTASASLRYRAEKHSATAIPSPIVTDFAGLFVLFIIGQWSEGSGVPSNSAGENGDKYLNNDNGNTYSKSAGTWSLIGNLRGPAFHVDAQGLLSTKGTYDAEAEDFSFLATDTGDVYFKNSATSGDWSAPMAFQGDPGIDGVDSFTYVAYASDASGTDFNLTPSSNLKYRAEIHSGTAIVTPILLDFSGATWVKYIGDNGTNGANAYLYIGFASDDQGTGWSQTPSISLPYMAVKLSSTVLTPSASDFTGLYVKYLGTNGTNGTNGSNGTNGTSSFVYIAYASDNTGTGWNLTPSVSLPYMAVKQSATALTPTSSDFSGATWVKYLGTDGENTGTTIETLLFRVPTMEDNSALHFALEVHDTADYSGTAVETFNSETAQTNLLISDGEEWLAFPSEGVGNPYYSEKLSVALQSVETDTQYYIRYKWFVAETDLAEIPWLLSQYPALEINNLEDKKLPLASFALIAPDTSIWDIAIGNDGVITRTKRV